MRSYNKEGLSTPLMLLKLIHKTLHVQFVPHTPWKREKEKKSKRQWKSLGLLIVKYAHSEILCKGLDVHDSGQYSYIEMKRNIMDTALETWVLKSLSLPYSWRKKKKKNKSMYNNDPHKRLSFPGCKNCLLCTSVTLPS